MSQQPSFDPKDTAENILKRCLVIFAKNSEITTRVDNILEETAREFWNETRTFSVSQIKQEFSQVLENALDSAFIESGLIEKLPSVNEYEETLQEFKELLGTHLSPLLSSKDKVKEVLEWIVMLAKTKELERLD